MSNILEYNNPYIELFNKYLDDGSDENVIFAIGALNAREQLSELTKTIDNDAKYIVSFAKYFDNKYKDNPAIWGTLYDAYLGTPRIFIVAKHFGYNK